MIEAWLPTGIASGALLLVWMGIKRHKNDIDDKLKCLKLDKKECLERYRDKKEQDLMCKNTYLEINAHISEEFKGLKKEILEAINGGKR
jgi:hypothetical protein